MTQTFGNADIQDPKKMYIALTGGWVEQVIHGFKGIY